MHEKHINALLELLSEKTAESMLHLRAGLLNLKLGEYEVALTHLERAAGQEIEDGHLYLLLAYLRMSGGDALKAESSFRKANTLLGEDFSALYGYGLFLYGQRRLGDSLRYLRRAMAIKPDDFDVLNDAGVVLYMLGKKEEAELCIRRALVSKPGSREALMNLGYVLDACGQRDEAERIVETLQRLGHDADARKLSDFLKGQRSGELDCVSLNIAGKLIQIDRFRIAGQREGKNGNSKIALSVIVPIMNEVDNIPILYGELKEVFRDLRQDHEIIMVDDGSTDGSLAVMSELAKRDSRLKVIVFRRNYGQTAAMSAGFKLARGDVVITMDGDLQNDPRDIPRLLEKMSEGYDLVSGWRFRRQDKLLTRRLPSLLANRLINKLIEGTGVQLHDFGCTLKAYKLGIVKNIHLYGEMHRFIPVFAAWLGTKVTEIPVGHRPRIHGSAKYNLSRVQRVVLDLIVVRFFSDYMTRPIQFFGKIALWMLLSGFGCMGLVLGLNLLGLLSDSAFPFLTLLGVLLACCSQTVIMGVLGEIMIRSYFENQDKDHYVIEQIINIEESRRCAA